MALPTLPLPSGIRSRQIPVNDISIHILEAGFENATSPPSKPLILLLHGFPEIAYSWRKIMLPLVAATGAYVVAPDQRGYGRTTGWNAEYDNPNIGDFTMTRAVRDMLGLVNALGYKEVYTLVGHDMGSSVAAWCALTRGDVFKKVVMISSPFAGPPSLAFGTAPPTLGSEDVNGEKKPDLPGDLAKIGRKPYKWYYSTREANKDMWDSAEGLEQFFRGYFHQKSADWLGNNPHPLTGWTAEEFAKMPRYYVMDLESTMRNVADADMPSPEEVATKSSKWLPQEELAVYAQEYARTGFQGGLNWYRTMTAQKTLSKDLELFSGMKITVPSMFMAGDKDWGRYQLPNVVQNYENVCTDYRGDTVIDGAGHWAQQEQPEKVLETLLKFIKS